MSETDVSSCNQFGVGCGGETQGTALGLRAMTDLMEGDSATGGAVEEGTGFNLFEGTGERRLAACLYLDERRSLEMGDSSVTTLDVVGPTT